MTSSLPPKRAKPAGKPIWPRIPAGFVRSVLAGHSALGLAFAALIYLVCFSGTLAVFAHEFARWEKPSAPMLQAVAPASVQRALAAAQAEFGSPAEHAYLTLPTPELPRFQISLDIGHGKVERKWFVDGAGALAGSADAAWTDFMSALHIYLHLPRTWGGFVVGLTGVALLSSLISGVLAHPRVFKDAFHLRWGGSKRLQEADLHNRIGVWGLPFHLIVTLTGALLGLATLIIGVLAMVVFDGDTGKVYEVFFGPPPIDDPRPAPLPNLVAALDGVERLTPGALPTFVAVEHPNERGQGVLVTARQPDRLALGENYTFDGAGGLIRAPKTVDRSMGERVFNVLAVLHFGWFGGWPIKIAYGLLGLGLTTVTSSGVAIWLARRRDKGRPAPRWERIWIAAVWGQPFAYAASMVGALAAPMIAPVAVWAAATAAALATALAWDVKAISARLRLATAALLVVAAASHLAIHRAAYADPMAWGVQASLIVVAVVLTATVLRKGVQPGS